MDETPGQQPRIPGVEYKKVTRYRLETTVIDGVPSTRRVAYDAWEPQPPRDWDEVILRGVTAVAIGFTVIAVTATTASVGGLLSKMVTDPVAYGMGAVFTLAWLYCLGIEWLNRVTPERARPAKIGGWVALLISMGAVYAYGHTLHQEYAGGFGACIDLLAKGSWWLLLRQHAVPLDAGVAHWVTEQEQKLAGRELLSGRLVRLNRRAAYQRAVGGAEIQAATAILQAAETAPTAVEASAPAPAAPVPPVPPAVPVQAPAAAAPVAPPVVAASAEAPAPAAPVPPATPPVSAPAAPPAGAQQAPVPPVAEIGRPSIAAVCRKAIGADPTVTDADLLDAVLKAGHPDRSNLPDTVRRTALRIDPNRKAS